jgi:hypothetical protein
MAKKIERMCVVCRHKGDKRQFRRIVNFAGTIALDRTGKAPGRGAYVCRNAECFYGGLLSGKLVAALKAPISAATAAALRTEWQELENGERPAQVLALIGLGRRGRNLVAGSQGAELAIKRGEAELLILAEDVAANTYKDFAELCRDRAVELYRICTKAELGRVTGADMRVAIAVTGADLAAGLRSVLAGGQNMAGSGDSDVALSANLTTATDVDHDSAAISIPETSEAENGKRSSPRAGH